MQNWERQRFEETWKDAFEGAEMTPSDSVWNSLEVSLSGDESKRMKRRVVFYQSLAAAMVIVALVSGIYAYVGTRGDESVASQEPGVRSQEPGVRSQEPGVRSQEPVVSNGQSVASSKEFVGRKAIGHDDGSRMTEGNTVPDNGAVALHPTDEEKLVAVDSVEGSKPATLIAQSDVDRNQQATSPVSDKKEIEEKKEVVLLSAEQINALAEAENKKAEKETGEGLWLGMGAAGGSYSPQGGTQAGPMFADAAQGSLSASGPKSPPPSSRRNSNGSAYSFGMSVGKKLGKRWMLQSGVNYIAQRIDYTSSFAAFDHSNQGRALVSEYLLTDNFAAISSTAPYTINSSIEMLSVPVQGGYLFIDRKIGLQMNAGLSTDFFIRNTLVDRSGSVSRFSQGAGEDSPYRSVILSGLLSTELSYKFGDHYRISLVPGMRYSFQSALKDTSGNGTPLVLDLGFRFKYIFR